VPPSVGIVVVAPVPNRIKVELVLAGLGDGSSHPSGTKASLG